MSFSDRIIQLKNERKLLQKDIASSIGLSLRAYQYYEKGQKEPTLSVLLRLADYFDVSLDYLVGLSDTPICFATCTCVRPEFFRFSISLMFFTTPCSFQH